MQNLEKQAALMREAKAKKHAGKKLGRTRNWTFLVYPESAPENWRDIINAKHIAWIESPLHEGEMNPDNEGEKKAHWHVMLMFENHKTFEQVLEFTKQINSPIPQKVNSAVGLVRYMVHMDDPKKKQYSVSDIKAHGGADVMAFLKPTSSTRYQYISEMMDFIKENSIMELSDLLDYARQERLEDWFPLLCDNSAYIIGQYIKSCRHSVMYADAEEIAEWDKLERDGMTWRQIAEPLGINHLIVKNLVRKFRNGNSE